MPRERPVFHRELGQFFEGLRSERGWSLRGAADQALRWHLPAVTYQTLFRLERGQLKFPEADLLRGLAHLYGRSYEELVERVVRSCYGTTDTDDRVAPETVQGPADRDVTAEPHQTLITEHVAARVPDQAMHEDAIAEYARQIIREVVALRKARLAAEERPRRA